ncbi:uncharacterized protein LOC114290925 isoform X2 [Camellia sinensis]|uniref:uncharacterized protein LOC114290925 isoform X2 n=1 Tax=Camellia sinensis TaxID=4442 RepID=UPI001035A958|nr:uncharacterized protein LOC114290925 isoform X2 [Camellia sinensis]
MSRQLVLGHLVHASSVAKKDILHENAQIQLRNARGHMSRQLVLGHLVHASSVAKKDILHENAQIQLRSAQGHLMRQVLWGHLVHALSVAKKDILHENAQFLPRNAQGHLVRQLVWGHFVHASSVAKKDTLHENAQIQLRNALGHVVRQLVWGHLVCASSVAKVDILHGNALIQLRYISSSQQASQDSRVLVVYVLVRKRNLESSTSTHKFSKENGDYVGLRSVPSDSGKARKKKKIQYEGGFTTPSSSKRRGGWITEDLGDLPHGKPKVHGWGSPVTPTNNRNTTYSSIQGGHASSSHSSRKTLHFGTSASNGYSNFYQQRYSVSRFGNFSYDGMRTNYDW